jgi:hypothetical protein
MAYYFGINQGSSEYNAASSTTVTTGKDVEVVVNTANVPDRNSLILALTKLQNFILQSKWPL